MIDIVRGWFEKHFSDPQAVILVVFLVFGSILILFWGEILTPVIASIIIAYVLEGLVCKIKNLGVPRYLAFIISYALFLAFVAITLFGLVPLIIKQVSQLIIDFPRIVSKLQELIVTFLEQYPMLADQELENMLANFSSELVGVGQALISASLSSAGDFFTILVYVVVVPLLVFFLLKDKAKILVWFKRFLPKDGGLSYSVWKEVDAKMGNYIRGKLVEILIVAVATFIPLTLMGMNYAATMSLLVGLSVIIPYVGAIAVTIPVAMIAWFQWGGTSDFVYLMAFYLGVQFLDGNILVPLLFSEVVNMHPAAIIISVLFFGGLWGIWGVFFAIPLATLVQAVINSWPSLQQAS